MSLNATGLADGQYARGQPFPSRKTRELTFAGTNQLLRHCFSVEN